ncbi:glycosyl hydrolase family 28-related protein [Paenibacillus anseongense]|uniref:glycosyl hydrolase family 28-related protein n=1 Tax=Paenibacillus anseongense TaxID=2682845 RepID=UPI002DB83808|nr:glycosyl hydrolase family 28-related protein [Paenibacillus anseongense]MEC0265133.1 glycosyl hydrolase family 28-related protein [Paenibacillus anseongense]
MYQQSVSALISENVGNTLTNYKTWGNIIYNVKDYGAKGDGVTDDTSAIQKAINAAGKYGGKVFFPPGTYKVTSTLYVRYHNITLEGASPNSSVILVVGDYGDTLVFEPRPGQINLLSVGASNLRFYTNDNTTKGAFIVCTMAFQSYFSNLILTEKFGGVLIQGGSNQFWDNIEATTDGLWTSVKAGSYLFKFTKSDSVMLNPLPSEMMINNINLRASSDHKYLDNAVVVEAGDGIFITNGHIGFANNAGMLVKQGGDDYTIGGLSVSNVWFDFCQFGVKFVDVPTAYAFTGYNTFSNCLFVGHTVTGMYCSHHAMMGLSFTGCHFGRSDSHAAHLASGKNISFHGCHFFDTKNNASGLQVQGETSNITVSGCEFYLSDIGTYNMGNGITLANNVDYVTVSGTSFKNTTTSDIADSSTGKNKKAVGIVSDKEMVSVSASGGGDLFLPITYDVFKLTGANNIGSISSQTSTKGRRVTLIGTGAISIFAANNLKINGSFNMTDLDTITLICDGTNWFEVSRSAN